MALRAGTATQAQAAAASRDERSSRSAGFGSGALAIRTFGLTVAGLTVIGLLGGCEQLLDKGDATVGPRARRLKTGTELSVVRSQLDVPGRRVVTGTGRVTVGMHFDPVLLDAKDVMSYTLWRRASRNVPWVAIGEFAADKLPVPLQFPEGVVGLSASARLSSGERVLDPVMSDEPPVWLVVDASPPEIEMLRPVNGAPIVRGNSVELAWAVNEVEPGSAPVALAWSGDGGNHWDPIGELGAASGHQSFRWRVPADAPDDVLLRVVVTDLAGHQGTETAALKVRSPDPSTNLLAGRLSSSTPRGSGGARSADSRVVPSSGRVGGAFRSGPSRGTARSGTSGRGSPLRGTGGVREITGNAEKRGRPIATLSRGNGVGEVPLPGTRHNVDAARSVNRTPAPSSSRVQLYPLRSSVIAGGKTVDVRWRGGAATTTAVQLEWSRDAGVTWASAARGVLGNGGCQWLVPCEDVRSARLRLRGESGDTLAQLATTFSIACTAPRVGLIGLPPIVGATATVDLRPEADGSGALLQGAEVFMAPTGSGAWQRLVSTRTQPTVDGRTVRLTMDLRHVSEATYDVYLRTRDALGNVAPAPSEGTEPMATMRVDKTPPTVRIQADASPWVEGAEAGVTIDATWTDVAGAIVLRGRSAADGSWRDLARWSPNGSGSAARARRFAWTVPAGLADGSGADLIAQIVVSDAAGNEVVSKLPAVRIEPAVALVGFSGSPLAARSARRIEWKLHTRTMAGLELHRVQVDHQASATSPWVSVCEDLSPRAECLWDVPDTTSSAPSHRVRVRLTRNGEVVSESLSDPFGIVARAPDGPQLRVSDESMEYLRLARTLADKHVAALSALAPGAPVPPAVEDLAGKARVNFLKALELDGRNFEAANEYAGFLMERPKPNLKEAERLLRGALAVNAHHAASNNDLGALYIMREDYPQAAKYLREACRLRPTAKAHFNLGLALFQQDQMSSARKNFQRALEVDTGRNLDPGTVYYFQIYSFLLENNKKAASELFEARKGTLGAQHRNELLKKISG